MDTLDFQLSDITDITVCSDPLTVIDHDALGGSTITDGDSDRGSCSSHGDSVYVDDLNDGDLRVIEEWIVPQFLNLRPKMAKSIVYVITLITNRNHAFHCLN